MACRRRCQGRTGYVGKKLIDALRWHLAWGDDPDKVRFLEYLQSTGEDVPALRDRPVLPPHLRFYWSAWFELHTDRQIGMDRGPIMFSSIDAYARRYGIDGVDAFSRFVFLVRSMDWEFMAFKFVTPAQPS